jgi:hypothetical protein
MTVLYQISLQSTISRSHHLQSSKQGLEDLGPQQTQIFYVACGA